MLYSMDTSLKTKNIQTSQTNIPVQWLDKYQWCTSVSSSQEHQSVTGLIWNVSEFLSHSCFHRVDAGY